MRILKFIFSFLFGLSVTSLNAQGSREYYSTAAQATRNAASKYPKECQDVINKLLAIANYDDCLAKDGTGCGQESKVTEADYTPCCAKALKEMGLWTGSETLPSQCTGTQSSVLNNKGLSYTEGDRKVDEKMLNMINSGKLMQDYLHSMSNSYINEIININTPRSEEQDREKQSSKEQTEMFKQELMKRLSTNSWNLGEVQSLSQDKSGRSIAIDNSSTIQPCEIGFSKINGNYQKYHTSFPNIDYYIATKDGKTNKYFLNNLTNEVLDQEDIETLESQFGNNIGLTNSAISSNELVFENNGDKPTFDPWNTKEQSNINSDILANNNTEQKQNENIKATDNRNINTNQQDQKNVDGLSKSQIGASEESLNSINKSNPQTEYPHLEGRILPGEFMPGNEFKPLTNLANKWIMDDVNGLAQTIGERMGEGLQDYLKQGIKSDRGKNIVQTTEEITEVSDYLNQFENVQKQIIKIEFPSDEYIDATIHNYSINKLVKHQVTKIKEIMTDITGDFFTNHIENPINDDLNQ